MVALLRTILEGTVRHVPRIAPLLQLPMAPEQTIVLQRFLEIFIILWALLPVTYIHIVPSLEPSGCAPRAACRGAVRFYCGLVVSLHRPGHPRRAAMATTFAHLLSHLDDERASWVREFRRDPTRLERHGAPAKLLPHPPPHLSPP